MTEVEPQVGQFWVHKTRGIELCIESVDHPQIVTPHPGLRARWKSTSGWMARESLLRNYRYDRTEPKTVLHRFGQVYQNMYAEICGALESMSDVDLITTFDAAEELDDRCWWATWAVRDEVRREARWILNHSREPFQRLHCSKMTPHVPHIWTRPRPNVRLAGELDNVAGRYYCKGRVTVEGGRRAPGVKVKLP